MLREKQMSVSRELEEKQTTCQQLQTSADELEVQIDTLSEERQRVSFQHLNYNSYPLVKDCVISWSSSFARNLCGGRWERVFDVSRPTFHGATTGSPAKWRLRNQGRYSILMTFHLPDLGSASDWSCRVGYFLQPIWSTTQIWLVTRHQYGLSAHISQTSLRGETSGGVVKCRL